MSYRKELSTSVCGFEGGKMPERCAKESQFTGEVGWSKLWAIHSVMDLGPRPIKGLQNLSRICGTGHAGHSVTWNVYPTYNDLLPTAWPSLIVLNSFSFHLQLFTLPQLAMLKILIHCAQNLCIFIKILSTSQGNFLQATIFTMNC